MVPETKPGIYRHYKGGLYRVLFTAYTSTNGADEDKEQVIYVSLTTGRINVRDWHQFNEWLCSDGPDGHYEGLRFTYVGDQVP